ncbi:uncharacterized protein LOC112568036 [Pomacea canaliculata]|uniref:uncharacterized protein LOC112568036 n=1 Tax=Pomacea canaliculata TaxID=400727 RepID=UPI000D730A87|nr:uncharacterized protein LOC112568036 [Pomacea canaliculata]
MKPVLYLILLSQLVPKGTTEAGCSADGETLFCKFSQDLNSTQSDFVVSFYPDDGGEEPLLDCAWIKSDIHCINQKGVAPQTPVSNTVAITIPTTFLNGNGSYKCVPEGFTHNSINECRFRGQNHVKGRMESLNNEENNFNGSPLTDSAVLVWHLSFVMASVSSATSAFLL